MVDDVMFPLVVDLQGRRVVVVGAGRVGVHKIEQLLKVGANVTVITREELVKVPGEVSSLLVRRYQPGDLKGAFLVVSATGDAYVNDQIVQESRALDILLNVVDDPERSNFFFTAVHRDGDVVVSVSTSGASPALAQWVRNFIATALPANLAAIATRLRSDRRAMHDSGESTEGRPWMDQVTSLLSESDHSSRTLHE